MKVTLLIFLLSLTMGCAGHRGEIVRPQPTMDDAIQAVAQLHVGMSYDDALEVILKHGIEPSSAMARTMGWHTSAILSDKSQLVLDFLYYYRDLRDKGPSELKGWRILDPSRKLVPEFSLYEPPSSPNKQKGRP